MRYSVEAREYMQNDLDDEKIVIQLVIKLLITKVSKKLHSKTSQNALKTDKNEIGIPKERYISPKKREQIIVELRLI